MRELTPAPTPARASLLARLEAALGSADLAERAYRVFVEQLRELAPPSGRRPSRTTAWRVRKRAELDAANAAAARFERTAEDQAIARARFLEGHRACCGVALDGTHAADCVHFGGAHNV